MSDEKLRPCAHCGSIRHGVFPPTCRKNDPYTPHDRAFPIVRCFGCLCEVPGKDWDHTSDSKTAVAAWNARADDDLVKELVEALEGLLDRYHVMGCGDGPEAIEAAAAIARAKQARGGGA